MSRPRRLLAREGASGDRARSDQARRAAGDAGDPRRREPPGPRADQGDRRHLLRPLGRAVGPVGRERPHQLRRPGRRLRSRARARRPARSPAINAEPDRRASTSPRARRLPRERRDRLHGRHEGRPVRHRRATSRSQMLAAPNPDGRSNRDVVRPWVNGARHHGPAARACGSSTSASTCRSARRRLRGAVRVRRARTSSPMRAQDRRASATRARGGCTRGRGPSMRGAAPASHRYIATPRLSQAPAVRLARRRTSLPTSALVVIRARRRLHLRRPALARPRAVGPRHGHAAREVESGFRYTPTTCFETFPFPRPHRRAARGRRRGRPPPRRAPRRLAQPARPRPRRPREAHPHQPLQPAPHLARPRPRRPRRRRPRRLRLARRPHRRAAILARLLALNLERPPA